MKNKILFILCLLTGLMMINAGLNKFFNYMPMPDLPAEVELVMGYFVGIKWLLPLVAIAEIIGGILLIIPKTRLIGAIVLFPLFVGIIVHNATFAPSNLGISFLLFAVTLVVMYEDKSRLLGLLR